jgi:hypothetical protein
VVIPCYNYGHFLETCVDSVVSQVGVDVDVLIVDDCSDDDSAARATELAARDPRVRAIVHEVNRGHIATYNDGIDATDGEYLLLLSADDLLLPGALERAVTALEKNPRVGLVYGFAPAFTDVPAARTSRLQHVSVWSGARWLELVMRTAKNPVRTPAAVMRREAWHHSGGYDVRLGHSADFMMWLRVARRWDIAYVGGADQAAYRIHDRNMHQSEEFAGLVKDLELRLECLDAYCSELDPVAAAPLRSSAHRALALDACRFAEQLGSSGAASRADADAALRFAAATWPPIVRSRRYARASVWVGDQEAEPRFNGLVSAYRELTHRVSWRTWRRFGYYL